MNDALELVRSLVALPGPPGQEEAVRSDLEKRLQEMGVTFQTDAKGNLLVIWPESPGEPFRPEVVVTAHMDEIALYVFAIESNGSLKVRPLGGAHPWKWGEGPVEILTRTGPIPGVLSFGSMHTSSPLSVSQQARNGPLTWEHSVVFTGLSAEDLALKGIRPGVRVVLGKARRAVTDLYPYIGSFFLDDRADLAVWLLTLEQLRKVEDLGTLVFAATVAEEVGGEGAAYLLNELRPTICVALEIGPRTVEHPFPIDPHPTIWVNDSFAATSPQDMDILEECCKELGIKPHWQALTSAGSDATLAAQKGLIARPVTLGLPVENSHGYEIMHRDAPAELSRLLTAYLRRVARVSESSFCNHR